MTVRMTIKQRVPLRRKVRKGNPITSLDHLIKCDWTIFGDTPISRYRWGRMMVTDVYDYVTQGVVFEAVFITNGEFYKHLTDDEILDTFGNEVKKIGIEEWKEQPVK